MLAWSYVNMNAPLELTTTKQALYVASHEVHHCTQSKWISRADRFCRNILLVVMTWRFFLHSLHGATFKETVSFTISQIVNCLIVLAARALVVTRLLHSDEVRADAGACKDGYAQGQIDYMRGDIAIRNRFSKASQTDHKRAYRALKRECPTVITVCERIRHWFVQSAERLSRPIKPSLLQIAKKISAPLPFIWKIARPFFKQHPTPESRIAAAEAYLARHSRP